MLLECICVASGCCCKEVYRYPHNNYYFPYSTPISSFWQYIASLFLCSFLKCFKIKLGRSWGVQLGRSVGAGGVQLLCCFLKETCYNYIYLMWPYNKNMLYGKLN